jgi:putative membrane protein
MRTLATLAGVLAGLLLTAGVVLWFGPGALAVALAQSGTPLLGVSLARVGSLCLRTATWRALLPAEGRPRFLRLLRLRWVGESVNTLLPVMAVGGDVARARLLVQQGVPVGAAGAAMVVDLALAVLAQTGFTIVGVAVLLGQGPGQAPPRAPLLVGAAALVACVGGLLVAARFGRRRLRALARRLPVLAAGARAPTPGPDVEEALEALLARRRALGVALAWHVAGWFSHAFETWLALFLLGAPVAAGAAVVIESLSASARAAAFVVPGGLGAQEGALTALALAYGVPAEAALSLALVKRLRELVVGAPGLLAWGLGERRLFERLLGRGPR